ncbi:MAG: MDR family MFS transporter [Vicinamibacterales bacterium]
MSGSGPTPTGISLRRRRAITAGLLLGMSLGAMEATVVGTAMPTVIASLGGLAHYSWVFSAYLLTSTASVPIWGRLSDLYGRRRMYLMGIGVFLAGSAASGAAGSMAQLIAARAFQGLGAGALVPLSMTIIGELYTMAERARTQALFSGVWGVASVAGPLVGGYVTDSLSWRWVFLLNLPLGVLALGVIAWAYPPSRRAAHVTVDWMGAALLFGGVSTLLLAIGGDTGAGIWWLVLAAGLLVTFWRVERQAPEPLLPLDLLRDPLMARTIAVVFLVGVALFGCIAFIPLFVQGVLGGSATEAGQVLTPLFLGWVVMSIVGARLTLGLGYRPVAIGGSILMTIGFAGLTRLTPSSARTTIFLWGSLIGSGMGCSMLSQLLAVQQAVPRSRLGIATSLNQFSRSVGAAIGVAVMGAILSRGLAGDVPIDEVAADAGLLGGAHAPALAAALHTVFVACALASAAGLVAALMLPAMRFAGGRPPEGVPEPTVPGTPASRPREERVSLTE